MKSVVVTGSTSGIGLAIATAFAENNANVVINGFGAADEIEAIRAKLDGLGKGKVLYHPADMTKPHEISDLIQTAVEQFDGVDILVNNAGIQHVEKIEDFPVEKWDQIIAINLSSSFHTIRNAVPHMKRKGWGRIINIASVIGVTGNAGQANYAAAKAGIIAFSKSLAKEIGSRGITVNVVAPGFIDTDMTKALPEEQRTGLVKSIALERLGEPADIANAVAFLAGPSASYITGETLHVNGGMYMP